MTLKAEITPGSIITLAHSIVENYYAVDHPSDVRPMLHGGKVAMIKAVRVITGKSLPEALDFVTTHGDFAVYDLNQRVEARKQTYNEGVYA